LQYDVQLAGGLAVDINHLCLINYGTEGDSPSFMSSDAIYAVDIRDDGYMMPFIDDTGIRDSLTGFSIGDGSLNLLSAQRQTGQQEEDKT
jgi:hypothetical protein